MAAYVMEFGGDSLTDTCGSSGGDISDQTFVFHHVLGWCFVGLLAAFSRLTLPSLFENRKGTVAPKCQGVIVMFDSA